MSGGLLLIIIAALLLFGPNKLPELGRAVGRTYREFKDATRDLTEDSSSVAKSESGSVTTEAQGERRDSRRLPE